jgi:hypothetical protein
VKPHPYLRDGGVGAACKIVAARHLAGFGCILRREVGGCKNGVFSREI